MAILVAGKNYSMGYSLFVKGVTLLLFASLATGFLLYRIGKLDSVFISDDRSIQGSPDGSVLRVKTVDTTIKPVKDSFSPLRLASSKSLILADEQKKPLPSAFGKKNSLQEVIGGQLIFPLLPKKLLTKLEQKPLKIFTAVHVDQNRKSVVDAE